MTTAKTKYHADVVGSLLRSQKLLDARGAMRGGKMPYPEYRAIEDAAIDDAIKLQEDVGLQVVTDGELRRDIYFGWWVSGMDGMSMIPGERVVHFHGKDPSADFDVQIPFQVTEKLTAKECPGLDEFNYASSKTDKVVKITLPSPLIMVANFWGKVSEEVYPDPRELATEARDVLVEWMKQLADAGCTYMQLDIPELAVAYGDKNFGDPNVTLPGMTLDEYLDFGTELVGSVAEVDLPGVTLAMHVCKGNGTQSWIGEGDYSEFSKHVFSKASGFDIYHFEYDDERSGDFSMLADLPDDKFAELGMVSTKWTDIEDADVLKGRIDEAAQYHPKENLGISTQCGFASAAETAEDRKVTDQTQTDKLKLLVDVADDVWG